MTTFQTTTRGLDRDLPVYRLWRKAKKLGIWDPESFDLSRDRQDRLALAPDEQEVLLHLTTLFQAGEESVTRELLPLLRVAADQGRLEEEMFLTSFLFEEAKHVEAFRRFIDEIAGAPGDLARFETPSYTRLFHEELPGAMRRLDEDASPEAVAAASVTYNMIVEGVLAETGYHAYRTILERRGLMPGMQELVAHVQRDEARHLAYGVHLLSRLVADHGPPLWQVVEGRMSELLGTALGVISEIFERYDPMPFDLTPDVFVEFALGQFQKRMDRIERGELED